MILGGVAAATGGGAMLGGMFGGSASVDVIFEVDSFRKTAAIGKDKKGDRAYIYADGEDVCGTADVSVRPNKKIDHQGVKVELIGQVEVLNDKSASYDFFCISKDVEPPGTLFESKQYKWKFGAVDLQSDTYWGINVKLRYFIRISIVKKFASNITKEVDMIVRNLHPVPDMNNPLKMEVGIEDCLHIEFEYDRSKYNLQDVVVGKVYFLLVRIKIKHMELNIVRKETTGNTSGDAKANTHTDSETLIKFEIMDGSPVKDQCIPVRLYLKGLDLTPTFKNAQNKFSVKYMLSLVLIDEEDRRYFKQQEIFLYRTAGQ